MLLHEDMVYRILQWLPVISLLRFKLVCKTWRAWIESNNFIQQHLHLHHYDPSLKDKNHNLICRLLGMHSPTTFQLTSMERFEQPNGTVQLNCSDPHGYITVKVLEIMSYNGIICLNLLNHKGKQSICLWNPATKQSRVLPQSPTLRLETEYGHLMSTIGFGFDVKNNDFKVVNLSKNNYPNEKRVKVYSLNTDSWRSVTDVSYFGGPFINPRMPFNNGTCFYWKVSISGSWRILCFDFSSEKFRLISFPVADYFESSLYASVVGDKIACVFNTNDRQTEIWMFNEYGNVNESWIKLHVIDDFCSTINRRMPVEWLSMDGNNLFFRTTTGFIVRYNVVKKTVKDWHSSRLKICTTGPLVEFKESLLSVGKGNNE